MQCTVALIRAAVVVFVRNDEVPHIATYETHQRAQEISFVTPKRLLLQNLPITDIAKRRVVPLTTTATVLAKSAQPPIGSFAEVTGQTEGRTPSSKRNLQHPVAKTTKSGLRVCEIQPA
jgi:hypothetical protein